MADANSFRRDLRNWTVRLQADTTKILADVVTATHASIVEGSPITGAPGQPVDTGALRASWQVNWEAPTSALISTNLPYAPSIEDGVSYAHGGKPLVFKSAVGGAHSVKMTVAGFDKLVDVAVRKVA